MSHCHDSRTTEGDCCCKHCVHDRITDPECCRCVPRRVCWSFQEDDEFEPPFIKILLHDADGHYTPIEITEGGSPPYWVGLDLTTNESNECIWRLRKGNDSDFTVVYATYDFLVSNALNGCLTNKDQYALAEDWDHFGTNGDVTLKINPYILVPVDEDLEPVCDNCVCFDECICIRHFYRTTIEVPGPDEVESEIREGYACFDPNVGDYGGWEYQFIQEIDNEDCTIAHRITIELGKDESGDCVLLLSDDRGYWDKVPYTSAHTCGGPFLAQWEYEVSSVGDTTIDIIITVDSSRCGDTCAKPCCVYLPEEITGTVSGGDLVGSFDFTLTRIACNHPEYYGTVDIVWDCLSNPDVGCEGTGTLEISVQCTGCQWNYVEDECRCGCDSSTPSLNGCYFLKEFDGASFVYDPAGPGCEGSPGNPGPGDPLLSQCYTGTTISTCNPLYARFPATMGGFGTCLDSFILEITE